MWRLEGCSKIESRLPKLTVISIASEYVWHAVGKSWPFGQEIQFSPKKNQKKNKKHRNYGQLFGYVEGAGSQTNDTRSTFMIPWNLGGITVQTSCVVGRWHQNWAYTSRVGICHSRHSRRECKNFASGVNFSRNNAIYNRNESTKYILYWFHL